MIKIKIDYVNGCIVYRISRGKQNCIIDTKLSVTSEEFEILKDPLENGNDCYFIPPELMMCMPMERTFEISGSQHVGKIQEGTPIDRGEGHFTRNLSRIQLSINSDISLLRGITYWAEATGVRNVLHSVISQFSNPKYHVGLLEYFTQQIESLLAMGKYGTVQNYRHTFNSISRFLEGEDISLRAVNAQFVELYNSYLTRRGLVRNSISFYLRVLRALYNKAAEQRLVPARDIFRHVYTGVDVTRKKAVGRACLQRLQNLVIADPALELTRNLFMFSFYTRGMPFVDVAYLRTENIKGDYIVYVRHKTTQVLSVKIEPCIMKIIRKYRSDDSSYVFPIIHSEEPLNAFKEYKNQLTIFNQNLKLLGRMVGASGPLSSYTARHSWATLARDSNIPVALISEAMGHTSEKTTKIYLKSIDDGQLDKVNEIVCKLL